VLSPLAEVAATTRADPPEAALPAFAAPAGPSSAAADETEKKPAATAARNRPARIENSYTGNRTVQYLYHAKKSVVRRIRLDPIKRVERD
jgi:hypothetical protein